MPDEKLSDYETELILLPGDNDLKDISVELSPGVFVSARMKNKWDKGIDLIASKIGVDTATIAIIAMDWHCEAKRVTPMILEVINTASGKGLTSIQLQLNKNSGVGDIMAFESLEDFPDDGSYVFSIFGAMPEMLVDTDFLNLDILNPSGNPTTCDFKIYGGHVDV